MADLSEVRQTLREVRLELLRKRNLLATGVGYKVVAGERTEELSIICSVATKQAPSTLSARDLVPGSVHGIPTDIVPTGPIYALQGHRERHRPAPGGVSIGHFAITAGTLGCLVRRDNELMILSNNHVLANSNDAAVGDAILQPGPADGGSNPDDKIAELTDFVPISFEESSTCPIAAVATAVPNAVAALTRRRTRLVAATRAATDNTVDAAIAKPLADSDVENVILEIGAITGVAEGTLGLSVQKSGRTTGLTTGTIDQIDATVRVNYGGSRVATFTDQLIAGPMSEGGDSGSAVLSDSRALVGLLFAGSTSTTIINRVQNVFAAFTLTLA